MVAQFHRKKSKRQTTKRRAKIEKKVRDHKKKQKKEARKHPNKLRRKDPGIPNSLPFKEAILREAEERKRRIEEEREKQKEKRKKDREKLLNKKRNLDNLVKDALKKTAEYEKKKGAHEKTEKYKGGKNVESSLKAYYKEFRKVVDASDVILEVLDARDPLGSRCVEMEQAILSASTNKRLVLILNKIDLVPRENVEAWLKHLKNEFPTLAFKASTQTQSDHLCHSKVKISVASQDLMQSSHCLGADVLMKLLGNYCRNKDIKTTIRVGVVGFPNTGKSSIINSLKRSKACNVGATPGVTKQMQEVQLDKHIRLLDSPGVVMAKGNSDTSTILKNCVKLETLDDPITPVEAILKRCSKQQMILHYGIPQYKDVSEFLALLARRFGRLKKGGVPDVNRAAKAVLQDWNGGKITYFTHPPEQTSLPTHISAELVTQMGKEFQIDDIQKDQEKILESLKPKSSRHMLVESAGQTSMVMEESEIPGEVEKEEEEVDEEMSEEEKSGDEDSGVEKMEEEEGIKELAHVTVSVPTSGNRSRTTSENRNSSIKKIGSIKNVDPATLEGGLPQHNKARKKDFKKMKKERRRRDKVAGELSDALTQAFGSGVGIDEQEGDDYSFAEHF
ncbi:hypothetical protein CHS0354_030755 [Potamilus streckersoni]|uniref:CP-type G domain-containing protein n=1 Tax=Potamilus streckersoni TaxID=2493646 RepID=A0AAE0TE92_9BIVA|nr:hypothetical protein CHS0354_030755 [Potamilus streckersoni]